MGKKIKEDSRVALVRDRYFYFFEIPYYITKDFFNYFVKSWAGFFGARDRIKEKKKVKDDTIESANIDDLVELIEKATLNYDTVSDAVQEIIDDIDGVTEPTLIGAINDFISMLNDIIIEQNNYNWYNANI